MFGFGKTDHDSIDSALQTAFDDEADDNCVDASPGPDSKYHLQYLVRDDDPPAINLTGIDNEPEGLEIASDLPFDIEETGDIYLLLECEADTPSEAFDELVTVAEVLNAPATLGNPRSFQTVSKGEVRDWWRGLLEKLAFWR